MPAPTVAAVPAKPQIPPEVLAAAIVDPVFGAKKMLGVDPLADYQAEILSALVSHDQVAARSANGVGKSFISAVAALIFFLCRRRGTVFIAGPKLEKAQIPYRVMLGLIERAPYRIPGRTYDGAWYGDADLSSWYVKPVTARDPESFAGTHAGDVLGIVEEASGEPDPIYEAIYGCVTGGNDRLLHIGNPTRSMGTFVGLWRNPSVRCITISALDSPNVKAGREIIPGLVSREGVARIISTFGRDSDAARVRVHGLPPRGSGDNIFSVEAIANAFARGRDPIPQNVYRPTFGGLDLARMGSDSSSLTTITGERIERIEKWEKLDAVESAARVAPWLASDKRRILAIDTGNIGAAVFDALVHRGYGPQLVPVNFGGKQVMGKERVNAGTGERTPWYFDRRSELWYEAAAWMRDRGAIGEQIPEDVAQELEDDLLAPCGGDAPNGSLRMESKDQTRKRLGRSPDIGDSLCLAVAASMYRRRPALPPAEDEQVGALGGAITRMKRSKPMRPVPDSDGRPKHFPELATSGRGARVLDGW